LAVVVVAALAAILSLTSIDVHAAAITADLDNASGLAAGNAVRVPAYPVNVTTAA